MTNLYIHTHTHTKYRAVHELHYHITHEADCVIVRILREAV